MLSPSVLWENPTLPFDGPGVTPPLRKSISVIFDKFLWSRESERDIIRSVCFAFAKETKSPWLSREWRWRSLKNKDMSSLDPGGVAVGKLASDVAVFADASPDQSVGESGGHSEDFGVYGAPSGVVFRLISGLSKGICSWLLGLLAVNGWQPGSNSTLRELEAVTTGEIIECIGRSSSVLTDPS